MKETLVVAALKRFVAPLPSFTIRGSDGSPYLTRWYVWPKGEAGVPRHLAERDTPFAVYIHLFHRSDLDRDPHDHPWNHAVSIVLAGGYVEDRDGVLCTRKPGDVNVINGNDFHRVTLLDERKGSWSLFVAGQRTKDWGFRQSDGTVIPWRAYLGL